MNVTGINLTEVNKKVYRKGREKIGYNRNAISGGNADRKS